MIDGWEFLLAEICIILCLIFSVFYFYKARTTDENLETLKKVNIGFGIMFLFIFISRLLDNPIGSMTNPANNIDLFGINLGNQAVYDVFGIFYYDSELWTFQFLGQPVVVKIWYFVNMFFLIGLAIATYFIEQAFIPRAKHVFFIILLITAILGFITAIFPIEGETFDLFSALDETDTIFGTVLGILGYLSFAVIPIIYFILAGKTTGHLKRNALLMAFGLIFVLVDIHTVGHHSSGAWYRSVPCLLGFLLIGLGNRK